MALVEIKINGRTYKLSCAQDEISNIEKIGEQLNHMATDIVSAVGPVNENLLLVMLAVLSKDEANNQSKTVINSDEDMKRILEKISEITKKIEKA